MTTWLWIFSLIDADDNMNKVGQRSNYEVFDVFIYRKLLLFLYQFFYWGADRVRLTEGIKNHSRRESPLRLNSQQKWSNVKQSTWGCYCVNHKLSSERSFFIFERKTLHAEPPHKGLYLCTRTSHSHARPQTNSSAKMPMIGSLYFSVFSLKKLKIN